MKKPKRYSFSFGGADYHKDKDGQWVRYEDAETMRLQVVRLQESLVKSRALVVDAAKAIIEADVELITDTLWAGDAMTAYEALWMAAEMLGAHTHDINIDPSSGCARCDIEG